MNTGLETVSEFERQDYAGMVTPTELRNLAVGLDASNSEAERVARLYKAAAELLGALQDLVAEPLRYNDSRIEIDCASHAAAMGRVRRARAAIAKATTGT